MTTDLSAVRIAFETRVDPHLEIWNISPDGVNGGITPAR